MNGERVQNFLKHYGVKGQKWGVTTKGKRSAASDRAPSDRAVKAKAKSLSNDDLKKHIERMRLEQQYSELANPGSRAGKKYAVELMKQSGSKLVGGIASAVATIAVGAVLGKHIADHEARKEVTKKTAIDKAEAARIAAAGGTP